VVHRIVGGNLEDHNVDDLAEGHILAIEQGSQGTSYILGGENLTMHELLVLLSEVTGLHAPTLKVPTALSLLAARASDLVEAGLLRREPHVPLEGARMAATQMRYDDARARDELAYTSRPAREALEDAVSFFLATGRVTDARAAQIRGR